MKLGRKKNQAEGVANSSVHTPKVNQSKKTFGIIAIVLITIALIAWVVMIGQKAEREVTVVMLSRPVYKNQVITEELLMPYNMLEGEFEKYSIVDSNGTKKRRLILWEEKEIILNSFAAYPLKAETYLEYRDCIKSRVDNTDNVLYSFPGKDIIPLNIGSEELQAFKTFLKPGDRLNIQAVFTETAKVTETDSYGISYSKDVTVLKTEEVFGSIMLADLINNQGESILDIYDEYDDMSVWQQAQLDNDKAFQDSTEPKALLVALTPEEKERYYYYLSKSDVQFKLSMPQRVN